MTEFKITVNPILTQIKATALGIGRELEREDYASMTAKEAESWAMGRAQERGFEDKKVQEYIAFLAMAYVLKKF